MASIIYNSSRALLKKTILAHCHVLRGQGKTADQAYLILVRQYLKGDICSECISEVFLMKKITPTLEPTYMKAEHLRIGNWVCIGTKYLQIIELNDERINYSARIENVRGILITPDILDKAGFIKPNEKVNYMTTEGQKDFHIFFEDGKCVAYFNIKVELNYLHELQNIYQAIFNQNLDINL